MVSEKESSESIEEVNVRWAGYRVGLVWNHRAHEFFDNPGLADSRKFFFLLCVWRFHNKENVGLILLTENFSLLYQGFAN